MLRPHSLPRNIATILLGVIYYPTSNKQKENIKLRDHIRINIDKFLMKHPNAMIIVTGDFNPSSTGMDKKSISSINSLKQLVCFNTRDSGIFDDCFYK